MLGNQYLLYGLNALSRAHESNYFADGHRGGAIISAVYLCREQPIEAAAAQAIATIIDDRWANSALCASFPDEEAEPQLLDQILECMRHHIEGLQEAGHNVILPTLALKAFRDLPEAITPSCVAGICRLIESFTPRDVPMSVEFTLPEMADLAGAAEFILSEFIQCTDRFQGRGQGWSGYLLTYGRALMDLRLLGYADLSSRAEAGYKIYIRRIRMGPQESDKVRAEHLPTHLSPLQAAYWQDRDGDLFLGHQLKYPYGFYGIMDKADDPDLKRRALAIAYRIF